MARKRSARLAFAANVLARDGRCLVCGSHVEESTLNPHHITTRGAGGSDDETNGIALCTWCHDDVHRGCTEIDGERIHLTAATLRWLLVLNYDYDYDSLLLGDDTDRATAERLYNRYTFHGITLF
jgi:predicted restriction endonuclease